MAFIASRTRLIPALIHPFRRASALRSELRRHAAFISVCAVLVRGCAAC
jgi:hypothetical protein